MQLLTAKYMYIYRIGPSFCFVSDTNAAMSKPNFSETFYQLPLHPPPDIRLFYVLDVFHSNFKKALGAPH